MRKVTIASDAAAVIAGVRFQVDKVYVSGALIVITALADLMKGSFLCTENLQECVQNDQKHRLRA